MRSKFNKAKQVWEDGWSGTRAGTEGIGAGASIGTHSPPEQTDHRH